MFSVSGKLFVQHHNPDILCICGGENWFNRSEVDFYKNLEALCLTSLRLRDTQSHGGISVYRNGVYIGGISVYRNGVYTS